MTRGVIGTTWDLLNNYCYFSVLFMFFAIDIMHGHGLNNKMRLKLTPMFSCTSC